MMLEGPWEPEGSWQVLRFKESVMEGGRDDYVT